MKRFLSQNIAMLVEMDIPQYNYSNNVILSVLILVNLFVSVPIHISLAFVWLSQFSQIWPHIPQPCLRYLPKCFSVRLCRQIPVWQLYCPSVMSALREAS